MKLLVVESTGKASLMLDFVRKTRPDENWQVISCNHHFVGLSPKSLSLNPKKEFAPTWKSRDRKYFRIVKSSVEKASEVYAATDLGPDGEAIAHQIAITAQKANKPFFRLRLPTLEADAFEAALALPGAVDEHKLGSFLAREAIDRFVRFQLGPTMGTKLGLQALERIPSLLLTELGRRERKIRRHAATEHWTVRALLESGALALSGPLSSEQEAEELVRRCRAAEPAYTSALNKALPPPPFTTSTLLQFLSDRYGFLPARSMKLCETLHNLGYITQPYTDSFYVSDAFLEKVRQHIEVDFGGMFLHEKKRRYVTGENAGGLEAIRPIDIGLTPSKSDIRGDLRTVYSAIWFNAIASQGLSSVLEQQLCEYSLPGSTDVVFTARGTRLATAGWHQLSSRLFLSPEQELVEDSLAILEASAFKEKSAPPLRHTAASLISWLDEKMVGRPHNYASSISFLLDAGYVQAAQKRLQITPHGEAVVTYLRKAAPDLIDPDFQAEVEEEIDSVAQGEETYSIFARDYWSWTQQTQERMSTTILRPRFRTSDGNKLRVWADRERVWAFSHKEDVWIPVKFDSRGRVISDADSE